MKKMGFAIGNHSRSHARFPKIDFEIQKAELLEANSILLKENLSEDLNFCFPFGDDSVNNEFFEWMYSEANILKSFGTAGLKKDHFINHLHRILMEHENFDASEIIKSEYIYYFLKSFFNKNKIRR
ncbi:peptidoglycan/xylan/chitin deacetylase (PgdA/CDA1 family) [Chryseobacterium sp. 16F]|uniref:Peptidoglycan/xylan/chitin deacetylase (PgdA/CDA1 family) n=2 Tax=Frigoriflavimonas asaccharolytica TaxID=2735899 RepID=A0A8J8G8L9_9FLAO|nr:peptidoglycan/xylan/chitin deacetylase (PgdA/CDA1 family) [Frigoriflavimonas asaccharolytica]